MIDLQWRPSAVVLVLALREAFRGSPDPFLSEPRQGSLITLTIRLIFIIIIIITITITIIITVTINRNRHSNSKSNSNNDKNSQSTSTRYAAPRIVRNENHCEIFVSSIFHT